jgi:gluconate 5-dehydrogenase
MKNELFDLSNKIALVTGSGQGIGFVIAQGLGKAGACVILNDINKEKLNKAISTLSKEGITVYGYPFDVTDKKQIHQQILAIEKKVEQIDILVNSVGIQRRGPLETIEESVWQEVIDVNLNSVFLTSQQVVKGMISRKSGKIINICSLQSELGRSTIAPYAASKGGVKMLTKAMAVEWAKYNIQVNGIGPGYFITDMTRTLAEDPKFDTWLRSRTPAGRWGDLSELAGTAIFLASRASSFVNGQIIYVDGGILASL